MAVRSLSTVQKTLAVLDLLGNSREPVRSIEAARVLGESPGTLHQRLVTLVDSGLVERTSEGRYRLSFKIIRYADIALEQADLGARVQDILDRAATKSSEAVSLCVLERTESVIVQRVESNGLLRADLRVGTRLPLSTSATGKVFLAFGSPELLEGLRQAGVPMPTAGELKRVRTKGYGVTVLPGTRRVAAVAAPVFSAQRKCVAAVALSGPEHGFDFVGSASLSIEAATEISMRLQGRPVEYDSISRRYA
jgi:DNA-binding IclR family transcriptional regulator